MMKIIEVEHMKPIINSGSLKASCSIVIAGKLRIADVKVIQAQGKTAFVATPSRPFEKDGQRKYVNIVEVLDQNLKDQIHQAVLTEYAKLESQPEENSAEKWF